MSPTIIEITATVDSSLDDRGSPYFERTLLTPHISSTTKFDRVMYAHLGFHAWSHDTRPIRSKNEQYIYAGYLEPSMDAMLNIAPFKLKLENIGDGFMAVHVRMKQGITSCKVTVLQERHQPRAPKEIDAFINYRDIYYCSTVINCLQTLKIEELHKL